jgi:hypothetical protein
MPAANLAHMRGRVRHHVRRGVLRKRCVAIVADAATEESAQTRAKIETALAERDNGPPRILDMTNGQSHVRQKEGVVGAMKRQP